jgi:23S rRNA pseudouridine1911/1915/1917 synthase
MSVTNEDDEGGEVRAAVAPADAGERVDAWLAKLWPDLSRARIQGLIGAGKLSVDGAPVTHAKDKPRSGARYELTLPPPEPAAPLPEEIPLNVVFEDEHLIVVDKPAGMAVHPAPGSMRGTLVNALLAHCGASLSGIGGVARPGIVHRIDKDVSGLLVVAKHDRAHIGLASQFSVHRIERAYEAITWGVPPRPSGSIDRPIGRHPGDRKRMAVLESGKRALTHYRLLEAFGTLAARLEAVLATGRTHQIRVHLATLGLGIIGDPVYRPRRRPPVSADLQRHVASFGRIALHACRLGFEHPVTGEWQRFERAPPPCFDVLRARLRMEVGIHD